MFFPNCSALGSDFSASMGGHELFPHAYEPRSVPAMAGFGLSFVVPTYMMLPRAWVATLTLATVVVVG